ncbi:MAG: hypothetical protein GXY67_06435 [Clostridiales bacterium]|nr:hypothetical protein [Clostridiales bacterium]
MIKSDQLKAALSILRERIANAKKRATHKGFIDYKGCLSVCHEFIAILEEAGQAAEQGNCIYAYSAASLVLVNCARLIGSADDSAGGINDTQRDVINVLKKACTGVEYGSPDAEYIYGQALKDSQNKAFERCDEFSYVLLLPIAALATAKNVHKLYNVLDILSERLRKKEYTSWHLEQDRLVRLSAITATEGEEAAEQYIAANLEFDEIRRIAIRQAVDNGGYDLAEKLCIEKITSTSYGYHWTRKWYSLLFDVYVKCGDPDKQAELAEDLLLHHHDDHYYPILKALLLEKGVWNTRFSSILDRLSQSLPYNSYMYILSQENERTRLLEELKMHPASVFHYGAQLSEHFPSVIYSLCLDEIRKQAAEANNRALYKHICGNIRKLAKYGGKAEADDVIAELKSKYPRRPAMLEELDLLAKRLAKKRRAP